MSEIEAYLQSDHEACPDFQIEKAQFRNQEGQFNHILNINDKFIFRFPRYSDGIERLRTEVRIFKH